MMRPQNIAPGSERTRKTKAERRGQRDIRVYVCAACRSHGGTLQRSERTGMLYHPEHLPERNT